MGDECSKAREEQVKRFCAGSVLALRNSKEGCLLVRVEKVRERVGSEE